MRDFSDLLVLDIVPDSLRGDPQIIAMAEALPPHLKQVTDSIPFIELYSRIDELPEPILRMLAVEHRVYRNEWTLADTIDKKRDLVKNSFELNQRRGTRWSVDRVLTLLNVDAVIQEWFEYGGDPYYFKVSLLSIGGETLTAAQIELLDKLVRQYKPLRSALESIDLTLRNDGDANGYWSAANTMIGILDVYSPTVVEITETVTGYAAVSRSMVLTIEAYPAE